jgi:hypothetical protein
MSPARRGVAAGLLTFFLGPPVGGFAYGLVAVVRQVSLSVVGQLPEGSTLGPHLLLVPIAFSFAAFLVAAQPALIAALYVAIRVGVTGRVSWIETVVLAIICLGFVPGAADDFVRNDFWASGWKGAVLFLPCLLLAAFLLRYSAGRLGLVR